MPLVSIKELLRDAQMDKYIIGHFEAWDYGSLKAVLKAAEQAESPVIIGFRGSSFETPSGYSEVKLASFTSAGKIMAQNSSVPCTFIFNEVFNLKIIKKGMEFGFNSVMFDGSSLDLEKNIELTKKVVREAARAGVDIEGQVGRIPSMSESANKSFLTSLKEASRFAEELIRQLGRW